MIATLALTALLFPIPSNDYSTAAASIKAPELRADVEFLASDTLQGRATPSKGLDLAADYIAADFKKAGLRPLSDGTYFQVAQWKQQFRKVDDQRLTFRSGGQSWEVRGAEIGVSAHFSGASGTLDSKPIRHIAFSELARATAESLGPAKDHVLVVAPPEPDLTEGRVLVQAMGRAGTVALEAGVSGVLFLDPANQVGNYDGRDGGGPTAPNTGSRAIPVLTLLNRQVAEAIARAEGGEISWSMPESAVRDVPVRNVIGVLPGSDEALSQTYVLLTAHYDHLGVRPGFGDRIYNGANDNASGVAGVMAIARALGALTVRPKRSIMFIAWFGEERGLQGANYFVRNPVVPLENIIGMVNLEQIGRTDDSEMPKVKQFEVTGFDLSDLTDSLVAGGETAGIRVLKHPRNSDAYFGASDNAALARAGIPAHTVSVAYSFPDYHAPGDHADKLDYDNMALVTRAILMGVAHLADRPNAPKWNEDNPRAQNFIEAAKKLRGDPPAPSRAYLG
ncbi:MAG: M20/M25/M40 family metallo-hydrolase [Fimbriimonadaceae bacterium]